MRVISSFDHSHLNNDSQSRVRGVLRPGVCTPGDGLNAFSQLHMKTFPRSSPSLASRVLNRQLGNLHVSWKDAPLLDSVNPPMEHSLHWSNPRAPLRHTSLRTVTDRVAPALARGNVQCFAIRCRASEHVRRSNCCSSTFLANGGLLSLLTLAAEFVAWNKNCGSLVWPPTTQPLMSTFPLERYAFFAISTSKSIEHVSVFIPCPASAPCSWQCSRCTFSLGL